MQPDSRVKRLRALQSLQEKMSLQDQTLNHTLPITDANGPRKEKFNRCVIEKSFTREIGSKLYTIRPNNESEFVIEISNEKESKSSIVPRNDRSLNIHLQQNQPKKRIYIHDYNIPDIDE